MDSGTYAACSALMARSQALDVLSNNLANLNTTGYKGESEFYQAMNAANTAPGALNAAVNQFGVVAGEGLNLSGGALQTTGNPLDVAIKGPGFLEVKTAAGVVYTRAGNLQAGADGTLETAAGDPVLGVNPAGLAQDKPIKLPSGAVSISSDGTISVGGATAGKIRLVEFPARTNLAPLGSAYVTAPPGSAKPAVASSLAVGALESSNVNAVQAETDLISLQRHFDLIERALQVMNTDFDQTAAVDLPRLS